MNTTWVNQFEDEMEEIAKDEYIEHLCSKSQLEQEFDDWIKYAYPDGEDWIADLCNTFDIGAGQDHQFLSSLN